MTFNGDSISVSGLNNEKLEWFPSERNAVDSLGIIKKGIIHYCRTRLLGIKSDTFSRGGTKTGVVRAVCFFVVFVFCVLFSAICFLYVTRE